MLTSNIKLHFPNWLHYCSDVKCVHLSALDLESWLDIFRKLLCRWFYVLLYDNLFSGYSYWLPLSSSINWLEASKWFCSHCFRITENGKTFFYMLFDFSEMSFVKKKWKCVLNLSLCPSYFNLFVDSLASVNSCLPNPLPPALLIFWFFFFS
jgi:hypothetical protein